MFQPSRTSTPSNDNEGKIFDIELTRHDVTLPQLPESHSGSTLIQLTDFHRGNGHVDGLIEAAVARTNALKPDYIVLTGDFVDRHKRDILPVVKSLARLRARTGIYAVLGNHDYYADAQLVESALDAAGIVVLKDNAVEAVPGLWFAGTDDLLKGKANVAAAMSDVPDHAAVVMLAHNPDTIRRVKTTRPMLMLSGHTHGGQIRLPLLTPYLTCWLHLHTRFVQGWYNKDQIKLYVNRGIGVSGSWPVGRRIRCTPEIALFHLL